MAKETDPFLKWYNSYLRLARKVKREYEKAGKQLPPMPPDVAESALYLHQQALLRYWHRAKNRVKRKGQK